MATAEGKRLNSYLYYYINKVSAREKQTQPINQPPQSTVKFNCRQTTLIDTSFSEDDYSSMRREEGGGSFFCPQVFVVIPKNGRDGIKITYHQGSSKI